MTVQKRPSAQQVAVAWLKTLTDLSGGVDVATTLAPMKAWSSQDFVVVGPSMGGIPNAYIVERVPVVQVDCFAKAPNSDRPAWNRASMTIESIRDATYGSQQFGTLTIPGGFMSVNLHSVTPMSEPRRLQSDVAAIARYSIDVQLGYTPVALVLV